MVGVSFALPRLDGSGCRASAGERLERDHGQRTNRRGGRIEEGRSFGGGLLLRGARKGEGLLLGGWRLQKGPPGQLSTSHVPAPTPFLPTIVSHRAVRRPIISPLARLGLESLDRLRVVGLQRLVRMYTHAQKGFQAQTDWSIRFSVGKRLQEICQMRK